MKESFLKERGIYYRINDFEPTRPTLVFVHGLSGSSSAWFPYEKIFQTKYNILSYDLRGHGKSAKPPKYGDYCLDNFADDLACLVASQKIENCVLISHSFGTLISLLFLSKYPNRVRAAVFLSPSFAVSKRKLAKATRPFLSLVNLLRPFPFHPKTGKHIDYSLYPNSGDWNIPRMIADVGNTTLRVYLYCTKQSYGFDQENFLQKINIPVLLIHGKKDTIFPADNSVFMSQKIKGSEIILIPNADHIIALNNVKEITEATRDFVEKNLTLITHR
ncbi:MAG: alpha/beta hydrolase [Candidatus Paceibacterota bacterium]|jgi:pimeloyl-ACP methyl ester carboxylesterase